MDLAWDEVGRKLASAGASETVISTTVISAGPSALNIPQIYVPDSPHEPERQWSLMDTFLPHVFS